MHFSFSRVPQRILPISGRDLFTHPIAPLLPSLPLTRELPFDLVLSASSRDSRLKDLFLLPRPHRDPAINPVSASLGQHLLLRYRYRYPLSPQDLDLPSERPHPQPLTTKSPPRRPSSNHTQRPRHRCGIYSIVLEATSSSTPSRRFPATYVYSIAIFPSRPRLPRPRLSISLCDRDRLAHSILSPLPTKDSHIALPSTRQSPAEPCLRQFPPPLSFEDRPASL